ncbi:lipopolysaccharide kinase InaA family protein [Nocardia panacis]|uniref:lipopolysaccharide kinase InaA family protein n=1 Tax=Nocardia panacis TaxID=2340916 RepID=UPI0013154B9A|nr:lipopolysaccharide kinase InaA family protein [Nocardia panacis]
MQNPDIAFARDPELIDGECQRDRRGMPKVASGGFAATFRIHNGDRHWAVRCFHRTGGGDRHLLERYQQIGNFITAHPALDFLVPVTYLSNGIKVGDNDFPTVRMRWVNGVSLGVWLARWASGPAPVPQAVETVRAAIGAAVAALRRNGVAHGDLQHGNILVRPDSSIWLIDYDGMYLPAIADYGAIEEGHRNYQHPDRGTHYDDTLDRFAAESIDLSLSALARRPRLWEDYGGTGENLLFTATDFADPEQSRVFDELKSIGDLADRVQRFRDACRAGYSDIETALCGRPPTTLHGPRTVAFGRVVPGDQADELRALAGEVVTVFGTVVSTKMPMDGVALINLGIWQSGDFTIVGFDEVAGALHKSHGRDGRYGKWLPRLEGERVAVTGLVTLFQSKHARQATPQIILDDARFLQILDDARLDEYERDARRRFDPSPAPPQQPKACDTRIETHHRSAAPSARSAAGTARTASRAPLETEREANRNAQLDKRYRNRKPGTSQVPPPDPRLPAAPAPKPAAAQRPQVSPPPSPGPVAPPANNRPPPVPPQYRTIRIDPALPPPSSHQAPPPPVPPVYVPPQPAYQPPPSQPIYRTSPAYSPLPARPSASPRQNRRRDAFFLILLVAAVVGLALVILL